MSQSENNANFENLLGKITSKFRERTASAPVPKPQKEESPDVKTVRQYRKDIECGKIDVKAHPLWELNMVN